jgi:alkanesulfonate monooxygenase SsuD/methylene tetrahydromethanopterin reductase-like flavin-dependent oxidoreductase (luciferase family)
VARSVSNPDDVARKYEVLRSHCEAIGRPYESVLRSYFTILLIIAETHDMVQAKLDAMPKQLRALFGSSIIAGTPYEVIVLCQALVHADVQYFIMQILLNDTETLQLLAQEVMPALQ